MSEWVFQNKEMIALLATLFGIVVGFLGVILNLSMARRNQERRQAFDAYNAYLTDCLANPELASGDVVFPKNVNHGWTHEFYTYQWLVARFLGAAEEVLRASPKEDYGSWHHAIVGDAYWHRRYFASDFFEEVELKMYSPIVQKIIEEAREQGKRETSETPRQERA